MNVFFMFNEIETFTISFVLYYINDETYTYIDLDDIFQEQETLNVHIYNIANLSKFIENFYHS